MSFRVIYLDHEAFQLATEPCAHCPVMGRAPMERTLMETPEMGYVWVMCRCGSIQRSITYNETDAIRVWNEEQILDGVIRALSAVPVVLNEYTQLH